MDLFNGFGGGLAEDAGVNQSTYDMISADNQAADADGGYRWGPGSFTNGASSWDQVLQNGFSRVLDAGINRAIMPESRATAPRKQSYSLSADLAQANQSGSLMRMVLIGAGLFLAVKLVKG